MRQQQQKREKRERGTVGDIAVNSVVGENRSAPGLGGEPGTDGRRSEGEYLGSTDVRAARMGYLA